MLLAMRKMQINTMRYYYTTIRMKLERLTIPSVGKDVEQLEFIHTTDANVK